MMDARARARREILAEVDAMADRLEEIGATYMGDFSHAEAAYFHVVEAALACWVELIAATDGVER